MRLKIDNATAWRTEDLRPILERAIREDGATVRTVRVRYTRQARGVSGHAHYGGTSFQVNLPSPGLLRKSAATARARIARGEWVDGAAWCDGWTRESVAAAVDGALPAHLLRDLAHVAAHELAHVRGIGHREMRGGYNGCVRGDWRHSDEFAWAEAMPVRETVATAVPREERVASLVEKREAVARKRLAEAEDRIKETASAMKRARTLRRKWAAKVAYYERKAACRAMPSRPTPTEER